MKMYRLRGVPPWRKIMQFNFHVFRPECDLRHAGIFDFKYVCVWQRHVEQDRQNHTNDAAMAKNADSLPGMLFDDLAHAWLDAFAELLAAFAVGHDALLDMVQPVVR